MGTQAGAKFYIAVDDVTGDALPQNADLDAAGYAALTWLQVKKVGNMGETGTSTNIVTYDTLDTDVSDKDKGISNAGDPAVEVGRLGTDPGQIQMRVAAEMPDKFAFKYELNDSLGTNGTIRYNRGIVTGPTTPQGANEDYDLEVYTLGLVQKQITVEAA